MSNASNSILKNYEQIVKAKQNSSSSGTGNAILDNYKYIRTAKAQGIDYETERAQREKLARRYSEVRAAEKDLSDFNRRYSAMLDRYNSDYANGGQWQSESQRQAWEKTLNDYKLQAAHWENWAKEYDDILGADASGSFAKMYQQTASMSADAASANKMYGQYGSEEEYNTARDNAKRLETYKGRSPEEIQADISRMEREGAYYENVRLEGDEYRVAYDRAVQDKADAERKLKDAQFSGAPQSVISEYQAEADKASAAVKLLEDEQSVAEERNKYQADIDWLKEYAPQLGYYYGVDQYGYSLDEMKPYEILDITPQSEGEQAWIEDYVENVAAQGGYIGVEDWTQAAEAQRAYDALEGPNRDAIIELADSYYNWQQLIGTEAAAPQEKRFWQKADEVSKVTGLTAQELLAQIETIYPYVAQMGANELREQAAKEATQHPGLATATTYFLQPLAGMQANAYLLGTELFGGTPTAANPAMTAYTYNTAIRGQVGKDIASGESGLIAGFIPTPKNEGFGIVRGDTGKWLYDAINSTVDSSVNMLLTRGALGTVGSGLSKAGQKWLGATVSNLVMGSGASAQRFIELKQAGYDDAQVVLGAVTSGLAEGLTEWLGGEFVLGEIKDYDDWLTAAVKSFVAEGTEEVLSAEMQSWYDWYLGQDTAGFARALFGAVAGFKAAGYSDKEAFIRAFSDTMLEYGSSYLAGGFSGLLHFAGGSAAKGAGKAAETYSYAKDVKADSGEMAAVNALVEKQKVNAPKLTAGDNIVRVMKTVKAAANEANYNSTKEALRQAGLMLREEMTKNGGEVSDSLIAAINKTTVAESISKVRELSREEARLLTLTKAEQRELNSKSARAVVDSLKQVAEGSESFSDKMHRMAADYAYGFADELKKVRGEATEAALKEISDTFMSGETSITEKPKLEKVLEAHPAANKAVVTKAYNAASDFNKEITVNDEGALELEGASPAAVAVMNAQYSGIKDEDSKDDFSVGAKAAYYTGVYYAGTNYGKALMDEIYAEYGDIKDELRAVYEQGAKEKEAAARTVGDGERIATAPTEPRNDTQVSGSDTQEGQTPQRKRGSVRNISAEEAEAAGVSTVDTSKLTKRQKTEGKILRSLAKQMGFDVVFFDSRRADGKPVLYNGWYSNGTIYIDVNAGYVNDTSMLRTTAHELTHFIQQYNAEAYSKLRDFIVDRYYEADRDAFETEVKRIIDAQKLGEGAAIDEVVADGCQMMLRDSAAPQMLYEHDAKLYEKVSAWVREWVNKLTDALKKALADVAPNSATARALSQTGDTMTELQKLWDEALVGAVENKAKSPAVNSEAVQYEVRGFAEQVDEVLAGKFPRGNAVYVGQTPEILAKIGLNGELPMLTTAKHLRDANAPKNDALHLHGLLETQIKALPQKIAEPVMLMDSLNKGSNSVIAVTDMIDGEGAPIIVAIKADGRGMYNGVEIDTNFVTSYYGKDGFSSYVKKNIEAGNILYINKKKAEALSTESNTQWFEQLKNYDFDVIIRKSRANVKQYSMRDPAQMAESMSDREVLAQALLTIAQNDAEIEKLTEYQQRIGEYNDKEARLSEVGKQIRELSFKEGPRDKAAIEALQAESAKLKAELNRFDKTLLSLEATAPLKALAERQRQAAVKAARAEKKETLKEYRTRRNESDAVKKYRKRIETTANTMLDWLTKNNDKKHVPEELKGPLVEFLEALDMSSDRSRAGGDQTKKELAYIRKFTRMRNAIESGRITVDGGTLDLGDAVKDAFEIMGEVPIYEMNMKQLQLVDKAMTSIKTAVTKANQTFQNKRYAETAAMAEESIKDYDELAKAAEKNPILKTLNSWFMWQNSTPYYAFRRLGPVGESLFEEIQEGWAKLAKHSRRIEKFANETYNEEEVKSWGQQIIELKLEGGQTVKMSATQAMSLYALSKRAAAQNHLLQGGIKLFDVVRKVNKWGKTETVTHNEVYHLTINDLAAVAQSLSERQVEVADKLQQFMTQVGADWGNEVSMARFGYKAFGERNYFPMSSDPDVLMGIDISGKQGGSNLYRLANLSPTKGLVEGANNTLVIGDMFEVFAGHVSDMAKYNALVLPMLDMVKWLNYKGTTKVTGADGKEVKRYDRSVQRSLKAAFGTKSVSGQKTGVAGGETGIAAAYIKQFIEDLNGASNTGVAPDYTTRFMGRYKKASVAANLRVAIQQPTSIARAAAVISPKYLKEGAKNIRQGIGEMLEYSGEAIWKDMGFFDTNIGTPLTDKLMYKHSKMDWIDDKTMWLAELGDRTVWGIIWNACKAEMSGKGYTDAVLMQKTAERFRQVIYSTQVMDATTTRSGWMRSNNFLAKTGTAFMSEPTLSVNMAVDAVYQYVRDIQKGGDTADAKVNAWRKHKGQITKAFTALAISKALTAIASSLVDALRDDDDFETFWEKYTDALGENLLDGIIILNDIPFVSDIFQGIFTNFGTGGMETAFITQTKKTIEILREVWNVHHNDAKPTEITYYGKMGTFGVIYEVFKMVSDYTGLPLGSASRDVAAIWNSTVGGLYPDLKWKTYNESPTAGYEKLYEAIVEGDQDAERKLYDLFVELGYDDETVRDGLKAQIKDHYLSGELSEEDAKDLLISEGYYSATGKGRDSVNYQIDSWSFVPEGDEKFGMYAELKSVLESGDAAEIKAVAKEASQRYGVTMDDIRSVITEVYKPMYVNGSEATRNRIKQTMLNTGFYDKDALDSQLEKWPKQQLEAQLKTRYLTADWAGRQEIRRGLQQSGLYTAEEINDKLKAWDEAAKEAEEEAALLR